MRALVASPNAEGNLELLDLDDVEPRPHEAVVDVKAVSLNRGEVRALESAEPGWRPGWDVAGVVAAGAAAGSGPKEGARVVGLVGSGAWAERVAVSAQMLAELPDEVSFEAAATL